MGDAIVKEMKRTDEEGERNEEKDNRRKRAESNQGKKFTWIKGRRKRKNKGAIKK